MLIISLHRCWEEAHFHAQEWGRLSIQKYPLQNTRMLGNFQWIYFWIAFFQWSMSKTLKAMRKKNEWNWSHRRNITMNGDLYTVLELKCHTKNTYFGWIKPVYWSEIWGILGAELKFYIFGQGIFYISAEGTSIKICPFLFLIWI